MKWEEAAKQSKRGTAVRVVKTGSGCPVAIINRYLNGEAYRYDMRCGKITKLDSLAVEGFDDWEPGK